jgi:hypothetical protein
MQPEQASPPRQEPRHADDEPGFPEIVTHFADHTDITLDLQTSLSQRGAIEQREAGANFSLEREWRV